MHVADSQHLGISKMTIMELAREGSASNAVEAEILRVSSGIMALSHVTFHPCYLLTHEIAHLMVVAVVGLVEYV